MKNLYIVSFLLFLSVAGLSLGNNLAVGILASLASLSSLAGYFIARKAEAKA